MITVGQIRSAIQHYYPSQGAEEWDNPGLQLGHAGKEVHHALLALELTPDVLEEAIRTDADLILTHHPFIFKPLK